MGQRHETGKGKETGSMKEPQPMVVAVKMKEGATSQGIRQPPDAGNSPQLTVRRKVGT